MNEGKSKKCDVIRIPPDLEDEVLSMSDPVYFKTILDAEDSYNIYNWVGLIGSAQMPVEYKLNLLRDLEKESMSLEAAVFLKKAVSLIEQAMKELYHPDLNFIFVYYDPLGFSGSIFTSKIYFENSYEEFLEAISIDRICDGLDADRGSRNDNRICYRLELYDTNSKYDYDEVYIYFCDPEGRVLYFRKCRDGAEKHGCDSDTLLLDDIFSGREDTKKWTSPYICPEKKVSEVDIYKFFNSKDEADYLKEADYQFTLPEAAFVVSQSVYTTLDEKVTAWNEMLETMPDCSMQGRYNLAPIVSFHQFLREYRELLQEILRRFYESGSAMYTYELYEPDPGGKDCGYDRYHFVELGTYFADAGTCIAHYWKNQQKYREEKVQRVRLIRCELVTDPAQDQCRQIRLETDTELKVLTVDVWGELSKGETELFHSFEGMCFTFPTPFHRGDLLISRVTEMRDSYLRGPFVLEQIAVWNAKDMEENGLLQISENANKIDERAERLKLKGDITDMNYAAVYVGTDEGRPGALISDNDWTYLNLERYKEPLRGKYRVLEKASEELTSNESKKGHPSC